MKTVRCAIYTRKSTEEGLDQDFNTLDAQRESAEAYIKSQQHEGWQRIPDLYDDGGFTGGNMERPALRRLLNDIEAGKVDCVIVYKVDRLSRSLLDFASILKTFEGHDVAFVSVTQQFNTSTSMGRLMLNVLLSFAQFERELISERTRDKIAASRRRGKHCGGPPVLGYDIEAKKLIVNDDEAEQVRQIFELYLDRQSLIDTANELNSRGWTTKRWLTKKGKPQGGSGFTKTNLHHLLTNVTYIGKVAYKDEVHEGEHDGIVPADVFDAVQICMKRRAQTNTHNKYGALLGGLLRCSACGCTMSHAYSKKPNRRYRYYVCNRAQKLGWDNCPSPSVPAHQIEQFVVGEIKAIGRDEELASRVLDEVRRQLDEESGVLKAEADRLKRQLRRDEEELLSVTAMGTGDAKHLADLQDRIRVGKERWLDVRRERRETLSETDVIHSLAEFDPVWESLSPGKQVQLIQLLIDQVEFNGTAETVSIRFHATGLKAIEEAVA